MTTFNEAHPAAEPALAIDTTPAPMQVATASPPPWFEFGRADTTTDNDFTVGPPETPTDCYERLRAQEVKFKAADLPVRTTRSGTRCGAEQAVIYQGSKHGVRYSPAPVVSCGLALALARFDEVLQQRAVEAFGSRVRSVRHLGTYSCRNMARFPGWVSEHSYANAIDVKSLQLESWRTINVSSYQRAQATEDARFLRDVARALFDEAIFSVVLTPAYDRLHHDHFHLDLARYRVDGT